MYIKTTVLIATSTLLTLCTAAAILPDLTPRDNETCCYPPPPVNSVLKEEVQIAAVIAMEHSSAETKIVKPSVDANVPTEVDLSDPSIRVVGTDGIWHNMNADGGFVTFRKWFKDDLNSMFLRVAKHVELGLYKLLSVSASEHSFVVICVTDKNLDEFPEGSLEG